MSPVKESRNTVRQALLFFALLAGALKTCAQTTWLQPAAFDAAAVAADDLAREAAGALPLYGRSLPLLVTNQVAGTWRVDGGERVWQLGIRSPGALALECLLDHVDVPTGSTLRVLSPAGRPLGGPVPLDLAAGTAEFSTPLVAGDSCILQYREPVDAAEPGTFRLAKIGHAYRSVEPWTAREGSCHVNVACEPESDGWEGPIQATVRISVVVPEGTGWCTGTLVNNVRQDCAPYILTAFHCGRTSTAAQFNQYKFYFNFQYATCNGGSYSTAQYLTGAQLKAYSDDYAPQFQGVGGSDFMLLRAHADVPGSFNPYWAGWDASNIPGVSADGVCIHHPTGAPKRISSFTETVTTGHPMASSGLMSHYKVKWAPTQNGFGVTEVGSSGSGLFKPSGTMGPLLIGTLTGSSAGMNCTNNGGTAYFGKMSYHWTNNPNTASLKLRPWLDPDNTGTLAMAGSAQPCSPAIGLPEFDLARTVRPAPNPADDHVVLLIPAGVPLPARAILVDALGRTVAERILQFDREVIPTRHLPAGLYALQVQQANGPLSNARLLISH
ncbi:MAG: T9SS type A sorting domain-containing protein [Flavobacteriales bacterium]|nr:T9SS type A sorting domain-containing protein [Flavobacteriales bacterium]MBP9080312.1 T9SS type A sorting domain-containing protein [Flavobacteriales bacterium]